MVVLASEIALVLVLYCTMEFPPCDSLFKSQRIYFRISMVRISIRPILLFVAEVMSNYLTTDGLKKNSLLPEAPLRPEARGVCHICHMFNPALHCVVIISLYKKNMNHIS